MTRRLPELPRHSNELAMLVWLLPPPPAGPSASERSVLSMIAAGANPDGTRSFRSDVRLAEMTAQSVKTVQRALRGLLPVSRPGSIRVGRYLQREPRRGLTEVGRARYEYTVNVERILADTADFEERVRARLDAEYEAALARRGNGQNDRWETDRMTVGQRTLSPEATDILSEGNGHSDGLGNGQPESRGNGHSVPFATYGPKEGRDHAKTITRNGLGGASPMTPGSRSSEALDAASGFGGYDEPVGAVA